MDMDQAMVVAKEFVALRDVNCYLNTMCLIMVKKSRQKSLLKTSNCLKNTWSEVPQVPHKTHMSSGGDAVSGAR